MAQRRAWSNAPTQAIQSGSQRHCRPSCQRDPVPQPPGRSDASTCYMEHSAAGMICCHVLHICHMLHMREALLHHVMPASQLDLAQQIMHPHPTTRAAPRQRGLGEHSGLTPSHVTLSCSPRQQLYSQMQRSCMLRTAPHTPTVLAQGPLSTPPAPAQAPALRSPPHALF
jgi:hypothetical protein